MLQTLAAMPAGVRLFLGYALAILAAIGLSMRWVIDMAVDVPVSLPGLVDMVLLAYTIFTISLVLERRQPAYGLALGLSSLTIPGVPLAWLTLAGLPAQVPVTLGLGFLAAALFHGLTRPVARAFFSEP